MSGDELEKAINEEIEELAISDSESAEGEEEHKESVAEASEEEDAEQVKKIVGGKEYTMEKGDKEKCLYDGAGLCVGTYDEENDALVPLPDSDSDSDDE